MAHSRGAGWLLGASRMARCGMVWYVVVVVVVEAPSTCRREKLPNTLFLGRAQGSSRPALRWPGGRRRRPRRGGCRLLSRGGRGRAPERNGGGNGGRDGGNTCLVTCGAPVPLASATGGGYVLCGGGVRGWRGRGLCMVYSCADAQKLRKGRSAKLSWRAARGYAGAQRDTALGRNTGPRKRVRCCVGARRGSPMQRSMRLRRELSVGSRRAQRAAVLECPLGRGQRVAHLLTTGVAAAGTAQGAKAAYSPERMGVNHSRASEPHKNGRRGALLESCGACS